MATYSKLVPLLPPRPESSVPPGLIASYERKGWMGQIKRNGQYSVIYVGPRAREVVVLNRHLQEHKNWSMDKKFLEPLLSHSKNGWTVFCAELLHGKVEGIRNQHYVHDILVQDGEWLLGETYAGRYARLQKMLVRPGTPMGDHEWFIHDHVSLARNIRTDLTDVFESLSAPEDEGLVLKDPTSVLTMKGSRGMVKCRRSTGNYQW